MSQSKNPSDNGPVRNGGSESSRIQVTESANDKKKVAQFRHIKRLPIAPVLPQPSGSFEHQGRQTVGKTTEIVIIGLVNMQARCLLLLEDIVGASMHNDNILSTFPRF